MKNICELLNIKYPIIQGGMANIANHILASSVSNAGGLGLIASGGENAEVIRKEIRLCKKLTDKPFGVNIMLLSPFAGDIAKMIIEEGVKVVTTGAGSPGIYIKEWKEAGITVIPVVPSVALAVRMERLGVDAVIVEGTEAGGHIGELTTMALVPQVVDAVSIPVIAAGGIADYRQVLAAFSLGAKGIQIGTLFLASKECPIHDNYKQMIINAKDTDTVVTGRFTNAPVRVLKNKMAREYLQLSAQNVDIKELEKLTLGSLRLAVIDGDIDNGSFMAGQVSGMIKEIKSVEDIIKDLFLPVKEYKEKLEIL
ncbi:MAG: enoyl-[acyl-carrier-protein] reductase FabK [Bacilli bacterium]|jgi:enoyl-[acyl-carrier protein] reductase II